MSRESEIIDTFVGLAGAMVGRLDPIDYLHQLCERCVALLTCDEAGVLVVDSVGRLHVMGCSSETTEALELLQTHHSEGPCVDCISEDRPVCSDDLDIDRRRWPRFAAAALRQGFGSVYTLPMRVRTEVIGTLNLFYARSGAAADSDRGLAQGLADLAAVALLQDRALRRSETVAEQLQEALVSRVTLEQAKGILAERLGADVDEAFRLLRSHARQHNIRIADLA
ncbi:MAG: GAF and ANTAR domain-containing protein, partial [Solirubrobacterales bacterium]|nr:GAF and ANTAR domain-containing protein [Solirubrobacterales bacterium]